MQLHAPPPVRRLLMSSTVAFAAFGSFWGAWGAAIPRVREQAGLDDAQLGIALVFVGAGALPAMLLTGRAIDRWGLRVAAVAIAALGGAGMVVAAAAHGLPGLSLALALVGMASGAADVAINSVAGRAERAAGRPVITRAHGVFSAFVVAGSLATGLLFGVGAPLLIPFAGVAVLGVGAAVLLVRALPAHRDGMDPCDSAPPRPRHAGAAVRVLPLLGIGALGALAFAGENAHQSWSAIFATDVLGADAALGAVAPAVFAATVALTRFSLGGIGVTHARTILAVGAAAAAVGAGVLAIAPNLPVAAVGLIIAAAGSAVLFPTVLSVVSARVTESHRGRATSIVTTVSYLGFLLGPVYVGLWSGALGLRGAMIAVAALGVLLLLATPMIGTPAPPARRRHQQPGGRRPSSASDRAARERLGAVTAEMARLRGDVSAAGRASRLTALGLARDDLLLVVAHAAGMEVSGAQPPLTPTRRRAIEQACSRAGSPVPTAETPPRYGSSA